MHSFQQCYERITMQYHELKFWLDASWISSPNWCCTMMISSASKSINYRMTSTVTTANTLIIQFSCGCLFSTHLPSQWASLCKWRRSWNNRKPIVWWRRGIIMNRQVVMMIAGNMRKQNVQRRCRWMTANTAAKATRCCCVWWAVDGVFILNRRRCAYCSFDWTWATSTFK